MIRAAALVLAGVALAGCSTPSLSGLGEQGRVEVEGLAGVWQSDGDAVFMIEAHEGRRYTYSMSGARAVVEFHVIEIDGHLIADSTLADDENDDWSDAMDPIFGAYVIPVHKFARVELRGDELYYADLSDGWVTDHAGPGLASLGGEVHVLTSGSGGIRELMRRAVKDADAFNTPITLRRLRPAPNEEDE